MIKNILDYQGTVIGQLELPDDTSDAVWAAKLAVYAKAPPTAPILDVTPRQMRSALLLQGITEDMIIGAINTLPSPQKELATISWEYSTAFQRSNTLTAQIGIMLGWTTDQLDDLWRFARTL